MKFKIIPLAATAALSCAAFASGASAGATTYDLHPSHPPRLGVQDLHPSHPPRFEVQDLHPSHPPRAF